MQESNLRWCDPGVRLATDHIPALSTFRSSRRRVGGSNPRGPESDLCFRSRCISALPTLRRFRRLSCARWLVGTGGIEPPGLGWSSGFTVRSRAVRDYVPMTPVRSGRFELPGGHEGPSASGWCVYPFRHDRGAGADGGSRNHTRPGLEPGPSTRWGTSACSAKTGTDGEIRTHTDPVLSRMPLPIGLRRRILRTALLSSPSCSGAIRTQKRRRPLPDDPGRGLRKRLCARALHGRPPGRMTQVRVGEAAEHVTHGFPR